MNAAVSIVLLAAVLGVIVFLLSRRENTRRSQYGPAGLSEFRTDLPLDECFDRLDEHRDADEFVYECRREKDGGFLLHLTLHQPTQQPLATLYTLRLDPGRQTVVTLIFIRDVYKRQGRTVPYRAGTAQWASTAPECQSRPEWSAGRW